MDCVRHLILLKILQQAHKRHLTYDSIDKCSLFGVVDIDGYICQSVNPRDPSPSEILSDYMGKAVHLVMKGPRARPCDPTPLFPSLEATGVFQVRSTTLLVFGNR